MQQSTEKITLQSSRSSGSALLTLHPFPLNNLHSSILTLQSSSHSTSLSPHRQFSLNLSLLTVCSHWTSLSSSSVLIDISLTLLLVPHLNHSLHLKNTFTHSHVHLRPFILWISKYVIKEFYPTGTRFAFVSHYTSQPLPSACKIQVVTTSTFFYFSEKLDVHPDIDAGI